MQEFLAKCSGCTDIFELTGKVENLKIILDPDPRISVRSDTLYHKCGGEISLASAPIPSGSYEVSINYIEDIPVKKGPPFKKKRTGKPVINEPVA